MFVLTITDKEGQKKKQKFSKNEIQIGRMPGNDLVLPSLNTSKIHARVIHQEGRTIIVDCESSNGTFVNGEKIQKRVIGNMDEIKIGDFAISVDYLEDGIVGTGGLPQIPPEPVADQYYRAQPPKPQFAPENMAPAPQMPDYADMGGFPQREAPKQSYMPPQAQRPSAPMKPPVAPQQSPSTRMGDIGPIPINQYVPEPQYAPIKPVEQKSAEVKELKDISDAIRIEIVSLKRDIQEIRAAINMNQQDCQRMLLTELKNLHLILGDYLRDFEKRLK